MKRDLAIVKDLQRHPLRHTVTHVDFLRIDRRRRAHRRRPGDRSRARPRRDAGERHGRPRAVLPDRERQAGRHPERARGRHLRAGHRRLDPRRRPRPAGGVTTDVDPEDAVVVTALTRAELERRGRAGEGEEGEGEEGEGAEVATARAATPPPSPPTDRPGPSPGPTAPAVGPDDRALRAHGPSTSGRERRGTRPTSSWSVLATPAPSTPAPATTWAPTSSTCWRHAMVVG